MPKIAKTRLTQDDLEAAWESRSEKSLSAIFSRSRICGLEGWQGMANSNTSPIITCANSTFHGGSYAQVHHPLTPAQVYRFASDFCQPHLDLRGKGKVTATVLLTVLFAAAARISSISRDLLAASTGAPCDDDLRQGPLRSTFMPSSRSSARSTPPSAPTCPGPCAAAASGRSASSSTSPSSPIMANTPLDDLEIYRGEKKAGTRSFFAYATAYVLLHGQRFTLAVVPGDPHRAAQGRAPGAAAPGEPRRGSVPGCCCWTAASTSAEIITLLAAGPAAVPDAGDLPRPRCRSSQGPSGSKVFKADEEERLVHPHGGRRQEEGPGQGHGVDLREAGADDGSAWAKEMAHLGVCLTGGSAPKRVDWVKRTYRKRFGIETSYRQMNQCRIRTTTKKFNVRFLYVAIGLLLRNLWVWLHHMVLSTPRRGCRRYNWDRLPVERMLLWLEQVAAELYGLVLTVTTERDVPQSVTT